MRSKRFGFLLSAALIFAMVFGVATQAASAVTYYVATDGDNFNSGAIDKPFQTIQKCAETAGSGDTCQIRKGTYRETVKPKSGIIITSYPDEKATVNGSDPVTTEWTLYKGSIYSTSYSASKELSSGETQVFVGQQMMTEARWPNGDDLFHVNWANLKAGTTETQVVDSSLPTINNNLPNINIDWTGAKVHFWSGKDPWTSQTGAITAAQSGKLTVSLDGASDGDSIIPREGGYYYLFGTLAALDTQGEWVYDSSAGKLYFWAPAGVDPKTLEVRVKTRQYAFDLSGKSNVTIRNINLFASAIKTDASSENNTIDGITAAYVSHYTTLPDTTTATDSQFDHLYDSGIILDGSGNVLKNSAISYSAGNGVVLIGNNNSAQNNLIHHVDYMANEPAGITVDGSGHKVQYNTIHDSGRYSIGMSSLRAAQPSDDDISYNNVYNAMMLSRDGAAVYAFSATVTGNKIHHNWIHDTQSLYSGPGDDFPLAGVYLDGDAAGWQVEQNVLWNNQNHNVFLHGSLTGLKAPNNNNISKNSIPDAGSNASIRLADIANCGSTQIVDNRVMVQPAVTQGIDALPEGTSFPVCTATNNSSTAPGATEMTSSVKLGCDFAGCSTDGPPIISGDSVAASIATQPYSVTVSAGQAATFSVTGAGSGTLSYQWQKNGVNLSGATDTSCKITATTSADNGAVFTVQVSNSFGSITSNSATLTVENNCAASVSSSLVVHIPVVTYSGSNYWADLQYNSADSTLSVSNAGIVSDASSYSNCMASSLSSDYKLHIPVIILNGLSYWADLQYSNSAFAVTGYGQN